jgi:hypothetical protein
MQNTIKIATFRGAGLSFPIACVLFFFLGQPYVFALVPAGALVGLAIGAFLARNPDIEHKLQTAIRPERTNIPRLNWVTKYLFHANLFIRLISLVVFGAGLLFMAWCIGYYLLPEGIFRGGAETQMVREALNTSSASTFEEWTSLFKANMLPVFIILVGSLMIRVNQVSLGYLTVLFNITGYGLFIGTNSFFIPMPFRMAPSLAILERSGPYEMLGLIVLAVASFGWSFFEIKQLFRTNPERVIPRSKIKTVEIAAFLLGIGILAAANWKEASMVMSAVLPN